MFYSLATSNFIILTTDSLKNLSKNADKSNRIILKPLYTEKTLSSQANGKYYFWVEKRATKSEIASAFETLLLFNH